MQRHIDLMTDSEWAAFGELCLAESIRREFDAHRALAAPRAQGGPPSYFEYCERGAK